MSAEVCLLLMQSLTGNCESHADNPVEKPSISIHETQAVETSVPSVSAKDEIAPTGTATEPTLQALCRSKHGREVALCALPSKGQRTSHASPAATIPLVGSTAIAAPQGNDSEIATASVTEPVDLQLPQPDRVALLPPVPPPQFSPSPSAGEHLPRSAASPTVHIRPSSGSQLYRQRQLALQSGRAYTRLSPSAYADQWQRIDRQPTYEDWKQLLVQEARAVAGGQGQNRLEVILGDSFGLWLPPEMLPRDRLWLNQSISGDTTAGILQRAGAFANTRATTIHLMAGANDLKNGVPESQIVQNLWQTVQSLRAQHPQATIVVYSVLPTRRAEIANNRVRSLNARIAELARFPGVEYRNIHPRFQDEWGHLHPDLTTDGLHLNSRGYGLWQQAILARSR